MLQEMKLLSVIIILNSLLLLNAVENDDCSKYKSLWFSYKYPYTEGLTKLSSPKSFGKVCTTSTCCGGTMQNEMVAVSKLRLQSIAEKHFQTMSELLLNTSTATNDYLLANIDSSRQQLNQMFLNTYSSNYKMHQTFFQDFYNKLKQYSEGKSDGLQSLFDNFFVDMAERIVSMMELVKKDPDTIRCLTNNLMKLDPYQGADKTIINLVINSYPLTRMFINSLRAANDVLMDLIKDKTIPSWDCAMSYSEAFYCSLCSGSKAKPCVNVCKSTIGKCLGSLNNKEISKLSKAWSKLVVTMDNLSKKLIHPFNVPEINKNLHVKISDAIMNVHTFFPTVRDNLWTKCKTPVSRKRRSSDWINQLQPSQTIVEDGQSSTNDKINLPTLIKTFSAKISDMKIHFKRFKSIICDDKQSSMVDPSGQCWSGVKVSSGSSTEPKPKRDNRNLPMDAAVKKSINKLNEISSILNSLIAGQNKDPKAFKIEFVPAPKKPANRQGDEIIPIVEGSGVDPDIASVAKKSKPKRVEPSIQPNESGVDGSGESNPPIVTDNKDTNVKPHFPTLPTIDPPAIVTVKPEPAAKKPVSTDDEDLAETPVDNPKKENPSVPVEGSGQTDNKHQPSLLPMMSTAAPIIATEQEPPKVPLVIERPIEGSGGGGGGGMEGGSPPDDETNKTPTEIHPRLPDIMRPRGTSDGSIVVVVPGGVVTDDSVAHIVPPAAHNTHLLPGHIPQEIWIPQVMDYDSYGRLVGVTTKRGAGRVVMGGWGVMVVVMVATMVVRVGGL